MIRRSVLLLAVLCCAADGPAARPAKPLGTWERSAGDHKIRFRFEAEQLRVQLENADGATITVDAAYGLTGDVVFGSITAVEKKGTDGGPAERDLFSFRVARDKDTLTVSELMGTHTSDDARQLVHGDYKKVADAKGGQ